VRQNEVLIAIELEFTPGFISRTREMGAAVGVLRSQADLN